MTKKLVTLAIALALSSAVGAQTSTSNGGAGGAGGSASGGSASGGTATNSNTISGAGSATATGGVGGTGGSGGVGYGGAATGGSSTAQGGASTAQGGASTSTSTGGNSGGNTLGADVSVNYILPSGPTGKDGLGVGVDPNTGRVVSETIFKYEGSQKIKNTPDIGIGGPASGPCNGFSAGVGVTVPGLGLGYNMSTVDEGCTTRETARIAAMLGRMDIANALMENLPMVRAALAAQAARARVEGEPLASARSTTTMPTAGQQVASEADNRKRQQELERQQVAAQQAIRRANTMAQVNDTIKFTDVTSQSKEKTLQEAMAEDAQRQLAQTQPPAATPAQTEAPPARNWFARWAYPDPKPVKQDSGARDATVVAATDAPARATPQAKSYEDIERDRLWTQLRPQSTP